MILSCIIHVLMVKNLTVNLPMSIKVECAHYCGKSTENSFLVGVVHVHIFNSIKYYEIYRKKRKSAYIFRSFSLSRKIKILNVLVSENVAVWCVNSP